MDEQSVESKEEEVMGDISSRCDFEGDLKPAIDEISIYLCRVCFACRKSF